MAPRQLLESYEGDNKNYYDDTTEKTTVTTKKQEILWKRVVPITMLHISAAYGFYLFCFKALWATNIFTFLGMVLSGIGITAGAHRLWTHRSYKAKLPLQIILLYLNTMALQNHVIHWARDHRLHHKYSDTDADPHNASRGFFYSHIGWLMMRKNPEVKAKGNTVDISDLTSDPLLRFQERYYLILATIAWLIIPTYIPTLWGESIWNATFVNIYRYTHILHVTCLVNSAAHMWGYVKPYDKSILPVETKIVSSLAFGEGFHNYHHTFPWDYKTSELGNYSLNVTTMFIDLMAKIGWADDLKTVSSDVIEKRAQRTGDGSHVVQH